MVYLPGVVDQTPSRGPVVVAGYVSRSRPAPASFDDPVFVIVPAHGPDTPYGPVDWPAIHGATMPVQGSPMWLAFDDNGAPICVSWKGPHA